jgi:hypothetical protein
MRFGRNEKSHWHELPRLMVIEVVVFHMWLAVDVPLPRGMAVRS